MSIHLSSVFGVRRALALLLAGVGLLLAHPVHAQPGVGSNLPAPRLMTVMPPGGKIGSSVEVTFTGTDLEEPEQLLFSHAGIKAEPLAAPAPPPPKPDPKQKKPKPGMGKPVISRFKVTIAPNVSPGIHDVRFVNKWGVSNPRAFVTGDLNEALEKEPNNDVEQAQRVELNTTINGSMAAPTDVDYYVFAGKKGQRVVFSCLASSIDSRFHAGLEVYDSKGKQLASGRDYNHNDALTDCTLTEDGDCFVRVFHFTHTQGTAEHFYRLTISTTPWIDAVFPCALEPGKATNVTVYGRNLPGGKLDPSAVVDDRVLEKITVSVTAPSDAGQRLAYSGVVSPRMAALDGFEYRLRNEAGLSNPFLLTLARAPVVLDNGSNDTPEKAQTIALPCEIAGHVEKRGDRDWYSFAAKKGEVYNIDILSDRLGAPTYMYFMLRTLKNELKESDDNPDILSNKFYARTEDPQTYRFVVPADDTYQLMVSSRVADTVASPRHYYRVRISSPQPDFHLIALAPGINRPAAMTVLAGGQQAFTIFAVRQDGFIGDITLSAEGLPPGVTAIPQTVGGDLRESRLALTAAPTAAAWAGEIKITGTATIQGKKVVREARSASMVWPVQPNQNIPTISRVDHSLMLAVRPGAPYSLTGTLDKATLIQGDKGTLKVKLARLSPDFKTPLTVQAIAAELPKGLTLNNNQPITIAANQTDGSLPILVPANVQPGVYTIVLRTQSQFPYNKDATAKQKPNTIVVLPSAPVTLTILPKSVATLALAPQSATVKLGKEAEITVRVTRQYGYDGEFKVQVVLPPNAKGVAIGDVVIPAGKDEAKLVVKTVAGAVPVNLGNLIVRATAMYQGHATTHEVKFNVNVVK
jgi:hypothetical protein